MKIKYLFIILYFLKITSAIAADEKADIFIYDLSGVEGYAQELVNTIKKYEKSVVIASSSYVEGITEKATQYSLETTGGKKVDWIIYIGHGNSCNGEINSLPGNEDKGLLPPNHFSKNKRWSNIKGLLIFGCAVVDIGDFGWGQSLNDKAHEGHVPYECDKYSNTDISDKENGKGMLGNYCNNYFGYLKEGDGYRCPNPEFPDPGLKWERLARENDIKYIVGFNFKAPEIKNNGESVLIKFIEKWLSNSDEDSFIEAWKDDSLTSSKIIERAYIRKDNDGTYRYAMGRASDISSRDEEHKKDYHLFWDWHNDQHKNWNFIPGRHLFKDNNEMNLDEYRNWCVYEDTPIYIENTEKFANYQPHVSELCKKGVIQEGKKFLPGNFITRAELAKIIAIGAKVPKLMSEKTFSDVNGGKTLPYDCNYQDAPEEENSWAFGCIRDLAEKQAIGGFHDREFKPGKYGTRAELTKMVMTAFLADDYPKNDGTLLEFAQDLKKEEWHYRFVEAAFKCGIYDEEDKGKFTGFTESHFGPNQNVSRGEVAVVVNRALRKKESGVKSCR